MAEEFTAKLFFLPPPHPFPSLPLPAALGKTSECLQAVITNSRPLRLNSSPCRGTPQTACMEQGTRKESQLAGVPPKSPQHKLF